MKLSTFVHKMLDLCAQGESVGVIDVLSALCSKGAQTFTELEVVMDTMSMSEAIIELAEQLTEAQLAEVATEMENS